MTKRANNKIFQALRPRNETAMEKTTRAVKEITDQEKQKRQEKVARLRKARHESEADAPERTAPTPPKGTKENP